MIKVLNLYAGIGGNRKLWDNVEVTAIENNKQIAKIYREFFPNDTVIIANAHQYLLDHYKEFDFIWSSPPCPSHSHIRKELAVEAKEQNKPIYPDMKLYEEILFLQGFCKVPWIVENVISWYEPLVKPYNVANHYFWSNFFIQKYKNKCRTHMGSIEELQQRKGFNLSYFNFNIDKRTILRNCVEPELGIHVFNCAFKTKQMTFFNKISD